MDGITDPWPRRWLITRTVVAWALFLVLLASAWQAWTFDIPAQMTAKKCVEWALANPNTTIYIADVVRSRIWTDSMPPLDPTISEALRTAQEGQPTTSGGP